MFEDLEFRFFKDANGLFMLADVIQHFYPQSAAGVRLLLHSFNPLEQRRKSVLQSKFEITRIQDVEQVIIGRRLFKTFFGQLDSFMIILRILEVVVCQISIED